MHVQEQQQLRTNMAGKALNLHRLIEGIANVLCIVTCLCIMAVLVSQYIPKHKTVAGYEKNGRAPSVPGVIYSRSPKNVLVFMSSSCGYCRDSTPFYRRMIKAAAASQGMRVVAVFSSTEIDPGSYLRDEGIAVDQIAIADFRKLSVNATPTVMLVDESGELLNFWIGMIPESAQESVLQELLKKKG